MAGTVFSCCTDHRRATLRTTPSLNGIDFLEVADLAPGELDADEAAEYASLPVAERDRLLWERRLSVAFVNPLTAQHKAALTPERLRISGGERPDSRNIGVAVLAVGADGVVLRATRPATSRSTACRSSPPRWTRHRRPASTRCCPRSTSRSRSTARPTSTACRATSVRPRSGRRSTSTISPRTTPPSGGSCSTGSARSIRTGASGTRPTSGSRWSSCWPTSATTSATARTRSRPRRTSAPRAGGSRSGATPAWSTTRCTTAAAPGPGSRSWSTTRCPPRGSSCRGSTPSPTSRPASSPVSPAPRRWTSRHRTGDRHGAAGGLRAPRRHHPLQASRPDGVLHLGRRGLLPPRRRDACHARRQDRRRSRSVTC